MESTKQKNVLYKLQEFERELSAYQPSDVTIISLQKIPLVLLAGPTAAGRNTLISLLVATNRFHYILSDTTRKKRSNNGVMEQDGKEYWFITEDEFLDGLKQGNYIEAALIHRQQVSGVNITRLKAAIDTNKIAINEIENQGVATYLKYKSDTLCIFLLPPNFEVWMQRIKGRGNTDEAELRRRLESAELEISDALDKDYYQFVVNYEIHEAAEAVDEIANGRALDNEKQQVGRNHAEQLLIDVQLFLSV